MLQRATIDERKLIFAAFINRCPHKRFSDPHVNLDYLRRILEITPVAVSEMANGMSSLGFTSSIKQHSDGDVLYFKWDSRFEFKDDDVMEYAHRKSSRVAIEMIVNTLVHLCEECTEALASTLDFSPLGDINALE